MDTKKANLQVINKLQVKLIKASGLQPVEWVVRYGAKVHQLGNNKELASLFCRLAS